MTPYRTSQKQIEIKFKKRSLFKTLLYKFKIFIRGKMQRQRFICCNRIVDLKLGNTQTMNSIYCQHCRMRFQWC